jgi:hypothetical protein
VTAPTVANQVAVWFDTTGRPGIDTINAGVQLITSDLNSADYVDMQSVCTALLGQLHTLQGEPPIPNSTMQQSWQQILADVTQGVSQCSNGDILNFPPVIEAATAPLNALQAELIQEASTESPGGNSTHALSITAARAAYLAAVAPVNVAINNYNTSSESASVAPAQQLVTALDTLVTTLSNDRWPPAAANAVHTLITDIPALVNALQLLVLDPSGNGTAFALAYPPAVSTFGSDTSEVRSALGLPASS